MLFDKSGKVIFRVKLTSAEQKALDEYIKKACEEYDREHCMEIDAMVLWALKEGFGWETEQLREFYDLFGPLFEELLERYEMTSTEGIWLCTHRLKESGIDLEQWDKERKANGG